MRLTLRMLGGSVQGKMGMAGIPAPIGINIYGSMKIGIPFFRSRTPQDKQFAKVRRGGRMSYEESYAKAFPFEKMFPGILNPEMIEDMAKIVNGATKDKVQVNLTINDRASGNASLIAQKIADRVH